MSHPESYKNTAHHCFYKRRSKAVALILSLAITCIAAQLIDIKDPIDVGFMVILVCYFPINLIIDIVLFKVLGKRESTKKNKEEFSKNVPMSLDVMDQYHMNLIDWRIAAMIISILYSTYLNNPFGHFFFYVPLSFISIPLSAWQMRSGVALKHFIGFKPSLSHDFSYRSSSSSDSTIFKNSSDNYSTYALSASSIPSPCVGFGAPGYNSYGAYTGSSTAIGGISN